MKIIFLNRFFYPDESATSQFLSDLAFHLVGGEYEIHVITSRRRYDDASSSFPGYERIRGVSVSRIWTTSFGRANLVGRAFDYLTFYSSAFARLLLLVRKGDIVIAKTDPPMLSIVAAMVVKVRSARLVNWLQDLFPEVAAAAGISWAKGGVGRPLTRMRDWSLRCAEQNVAVGEKMSEALVARGLHQTKIIVIPNWANGEAIRPVARTENPLRTKWGLDGKFVVGYSGNLGRAHELDTVLVAMEKLRADSRIFFVFIGGGKQRQKLEAECRKRNIASVAFLPYQAREDLIWSLSIPELHLVTLLPEMEGFVVPSKVYGIAAAGRPVVNIGAQDGEIALLVRKHDCGMTIQPGDSAGLVAAIEQLASDENLCSKMGRNARRALDNDYDMRHALQKWSKLLDTVAAT